MERHVFPKGLAAAAFALLLTLVAAAQDGGSDEPAPPKPSADTKKPAAEGPDVPVVAPVDGAKPAPRVGPPSIGDALPETLPVRRLGAAEDEAAGMTLATLLGEPARPLVIVFWSATCPVCKRYETALSKLASDLRDDAGFLVIASGADQESDAVREFARRSSLVATLVMDREGATARALGVRVTPTTLVVDAAGVLRYSGPLDDDRRAGRSRDARALLRPAIAAVVKGKAPELAEARAFGSAIR